MSDLTPAETVQRAAAVMTRALQPIIPAVHGASGLAWPAYYEKRDRTDGRPPRKYSLDDPRFVLLLLIREWQSFHGAVTPVHSAWAREVRETLNRVAHEPDSVDLPAARRAIETMGLLTSNVSRDGHARTQIDDLARSLDGVDESADPTPTTYGVPAAEREVEAPGLFDQVEANNALSETHEFIEVPVSTEQVEDRPELGPGLRRIRVAAGAVSATVIHQANLNYAAANQHLSPLLDLELENASDVEQRVLALTLDLDGLNADTSGLALGPIDLAPGELRSLTREELSWPLDHRAFAELEEARSGRLELRLTVSDTTATGHGAVRLLARDEWDAANTPELLAAFVTPNQPEISALLDGASDGLAQATGSRSLVGYQDDAQRVIETAKSIYDAIKAMGIRYAPPPASFEETGQKVRRPEDVLNERWGTCLDLSVLYASALEAAGINPVIVVLQDHAFAGFLTEEVKLVELATRSKEQITNVVRSGIFVPVELTGATASEDMSFEEAQRSTERFWDQDIDQVRFLLDVAACRRRIRPMPRVRRDGDAVVIEVQRPAAMKLPTSRPDTARRATVPTGPQRVERWRNALLDLSFRNPLLKLSDRGATKLHVPERALGQFEDILSSGQAVTLSPGLELQESVHQGETDIRRVDDQSITEILGAEGRVHALITQERIGRSLDALRRRAKTVLEETGSNNLFVTLGALRWKDARGKDALAPLFLLPVHLDGRAGSTYRVTSEGDTAHLPNYCLIEKLRRDHEIEIPELENPPRDDSGIDVPAVLQAVRRAMTLHGKTFGVESDVRIAILQFSTLEMWRDVTENWHRLMSNSVVRHLVETPTATYVDEVTAPPVTELTEAEEHLPVQTDGSQLQAIRWAREGRTFVLEGPPGTGKSQTITNMIANALAHGQTVLFVAEKQAALEVVRRRLDSAGLGPLTVDLHGRNQTIKHVRAQLEEAWDYTVEADDQYDAARRRLKAEVQNLADYADRVHRPGPAGISLWQAHEGVLHHPGNQSAGIEVPAQVVTGRRSVDEVFDVARAAQTSLRAIDGRLAEQPWVLAGPAADGSDIEAIGAALQKLHAARNVLPPKAVQLISDATTAQLPELVGVVQRLAVEPRIALPQADAASWAQDLRRLSSELDDYQRRHAQMLPYLTDAAKRADVQALRANLVGAMNAGAIRRGRLLRTATAQIAALWKGQPLRTEQLHVFLNELEEVQRGGQQLFHRVTQALPGDHTPDVEHGGRRIGDLAIALDSWGRADFGVNAPKVSAYVAAAGAGAAQPAYDHQALQAFVDTWHGFTRALGTSEGSIDGWLHGRSLLTALDASMPVWEEAVRLGHTGSLLRVRRANADMQQLRRLGFNDLADQLTDGRIPPDGLPELVETKVAQAIERQRLDETGLHVFRVKHRNESIRDLARASEDARDHARSAIPALVRRRRSVDTRHPSNDLAALRSEFQRKRGGSIRELVKNHAPALLKLTPCLLMSPASVARYVPADSTTFDLVIFDEASQIRVADAVGALGRSRAAVIVGDSQQMPPTSMFRSSVDVEEDDNSATEAVVPVDQDSILKECVDSNIERLRLTWHYRSRDESLIAFSNGAYYRNELASFPTPPGGLTGTTDGVHFRFVGGHYDGGTGASRTNEIEAEAIVAEIKDRLEADPEMSLGVVTLNSQQRDLILDRLETMTGRVRQALNRESDALFVKNLENVQGDERDVILFSLAFSPDPETGVLRLNFGPVMTEGGERRLNVAITRARHEVVLFSSFQPEDIDLSRTASKGLRDLRAYLIFARDHSVESTQGTTRSASKGHQADVASALRSAGLEVTENLGMSGFKVDLAVRDRDSARWVAVLLDGPGWARRAIASDRDVLPNSILTGNMGWPKVERVWLPGWIRDRNAVINRIIEAAREVASLPEPEVATAEHDSATEIEDALRASDAQQTDAQPPARIASLPKEETRTEPLTDETVGSSSPADLIDHVDHQPRHASSAASSAPRAVQLVQFRAAHSETVLLDGALDRLDDPVTRAQVRRRVDEVVALEGPVESQRLAYLVGQSFGVLRMRKSRVDDLLSMLPDDRRHREGEHEFVWPEGTSPEQYQLVRTSRDEPARPIDTICRVELGNAIHHVLAEPGGLNRDELRRRVMALFGFRREGATIRTRLDEVIDRLAARQQLRLMGKFVVLDK